MDPCRKCSQLVVDKTHMRWSICTPCLSQKILETPKSHKRMLEQEIASRAAYDAYEIALPAKKPETEEEKSRRERQEQIERWQKALRDDEARLAKERVGKQSRSPFEFDLKASKNNLLLGSILADCATIIHAATIKEKDEMCQTQMNRVPNIATSIIKVPIHKPEYDENAAGKSSNVEGFKLANSIVDHINMAVGHNIRKKYQETCVQDLTANLGFFGSWSARSIGTIAKSRYQMPTETIKTASIILPTRTILSDSTMETNVKVARKEEEELNSASQESDDENWDFELDELSLEELEEDQEILEETPHQQQSFTDSFEAQIA
ncbi:hypothetical protein GLAREA_02574 [Glarea lozoyensis ATCC 20868]|uniref:Uncharacterized protein n=1 Tax=Glarea lozoyensis (strain ATCC 20868 / MF5171) TaxID=1116229 RepID=S3D3M0_GLAL2|nr:uncharacterized protein GLAREA_02574 [Glarea lozoyensis ATCC 20868]EPE26661.1 hypothetical protein GLAREA_02574 [Glarea lozoyensis ATCC 20868]